MKTSMIAMVAGALLLLGGMVACGDDDDSPAAGGAGGGTGGSETGGTGGGEETGGTGGGGETGGTGGGETGGTGGGTATGDCASACANIAAANCPAEDDAATCTAECTAVMSGHMAECGSEVDAFLGCVATAEIVCDDEEGDAQILGCDSEAVAYFTCTACEPHPEDKACDVCEKNNCCDEWKAFLADQSQENLDALDECSELNCATECEWE